MRHSHLILLGMLGVVVLASLLPLVMVRWVRAQQPSDAFVGKHLTLTPVLRGFQEPTLVAWLPDGSQRAVVLERGGQVRLADADGQVRPAPFLDLSQKVSLGNEEGLLGLAFDPGFAQNGYLYVDYTDQDRSIQVVRYTVSAGQPDVVDPGTARVVLNVPKLSKYHQAGMLAFGPDGDLYVSVGDDEQSERAQDLGVLLGKILRLDVTSAEPYAIPPSNPFVGTDARGEIWDYGLRNPWRFSFDRATGDLWIGDVHHIDGDGGQNWESVVLQPAHSPGGVNFGFPLQATFHCADVLDCHPPGVSLPVVQYDHNMNCSVTGGYVYRGAAIPALVGTYLFGDYCTGGIFAVRGSPDQGWSARLELDYVPGVKISSFGQDPAGELYVVDSQGGTIYRIADGSLP